MSVALQRHTYYLTYRPDLPENQLTGYHFIYQKLISDHAQTLRMYPFSVLSYLCPNT